MATIAGVGQADVRSLELPATSPTWVAGTQEYSHHFCLPRELISRKLEGKQKWPVSVSLGENAALEAPPQTRLGKG